MYPLIHSTSATQQTTFKSKWNTFKEWFTPELLNKRRPSQCSTTSTFSSSTICSCDMMSKRPSITNSANLPFNKRRLSCCSATQDVPIEVEMEKLYELYHLAQDEINYAEDSRGSPYYQNDRIAAKEAIDQCKVFYHQLGIEDQAIAIKISTLSNKLDSLPLEDADAASI